MTWWMPWSRPDAKTVLEREGVSPFLNGLAPEISPVFTNFRNQTSTSCAISSPASRRDRGTINIGLFLCMGEGAGVRHRSDRPGRWHANAHPDSSRVGDWGGVRPAMGPAIGFRWEWGLLRWVEFGS